MVQAGVILPVRPSSSPLTSWRSPDWACSAPVAGSLCRALSFLTSNRAADSPSRPPNRPTLPPSSQLSLISGDRSLLVRAMAVAAPTIEVPCGVADRPQDR